MTNLLFLPIAYGGGDGEAVAVPNDVLDDLIKDLRTKFGGLTFMPDAFGEWIDREGRFRPDRHRLVLVDVPESRAEEMDEWVKYAGRVLEQDVMLLLRNFCEASFIEVESWS